MRKHGSRIIYSPSDLATFVESRFATWMTRFDLEQPGEVERDAVTEDQEIILRKGRQHESAVLERLEADGREVVEIADGGDRLKATRDAMSAEADVVYQAALARDDCFGYADFLVRNTDGDGRTVYEPLEAKLARRPTPRALIQLMSYADMLESTSGELPGRVHLALGDGREVSLRTEEFIYYYRALQTAFREFMARWDPSTPPLPEPHAEHRPWRAEAEKLTLARDHVSRVARISTRHVQKLEAAGLTTMGQLAATEIERVAGLQDEVFRRLRTQAELQVASVGAERPAFRALQPPASDPSAGLGGLPPRSELDVYFDMEGYPLANPPIEYLFGATFTQGADRCFRDWWAHDRDGERAAFEGFVDWVFDRWQHDPDMHVYHYAAYETHALKRLMGQFGSREREIDQLLKAGVFVDLYQVVRGGLLVGEPRYSIKNLERLFREAREGDVGTAVDSIVYYERWLASGEPRDWRESPILREIRSYNRDDCDSTLLLAEWLRERQAELGVEWTSTADPARRERPELERREELVVRLAPAEEQVSSTDRLLSQLLEFHRREERPMWWSMFERHEMSEEELTEDVNCLGGLTPAGDPPEDVKRSRRFHYAFDPDQETKIAPGKRCYFAHDLEIQAEVDELDLERGRVALRLGPSALAAIGETPPERLSLIPDEYHPTDVITGSIERTARRRLEGQPVQPALADFLERRPPRIEGHAGGPLVGPGETTTEAALRLAAAMQETTLFIQGPPGSGKTTLAARMILDLHRRGKCIGIASNSHKAIVNLMRKCAELSDWKLPCVKVGGRPDPELHERCRGAEHVERNNGAAAKLLRLSLIGGTAWLFSRPELADRLDYLFVDEAGQVSVANLVGMAPSASNLVLIGDQMQLPQPIQGSHPGDSGRSTLEYYLEEAPTIPAERGIFLGTTFRLHPELCELISQSFYEGRLVPAKDNARRILRLPAEPERIPQEAGVLFVPVEHEGNTQASIEEVEAIDRLVGELVGRELTATDGATVGPLEPEQILVVAPYNLQVRKLQQRLPECVRVGTVDRFQGQEAPVVIVSLCASEGHASPRGIEFLLNPNRLNVALSRAQCLAIVVGHPGLCETRCSTVEQMKLVNLICRMWQGTE